LMKRGPRPVTLALARKLWLTLRRSATSVVVRSGSVVDIVSFVLLHPAELLSMRGYAKPILGSHDGMNFLLELFRRGLALCQAPLKPFCACS
jgi:hypothetical protein